MSNAVYSRIIEAGAIPTRSDIEELFMSLGSPGKNRELKRQAVERIFEEIGHSGRNIQGFSVLETLNSYRNW